MKETRSKINKLIELMGFRDFFSISPDDESNKISIIINDKGISQEELPFFVFNINKIARLIAKKNDEGPLVVVDINNYRKEREHLIVKLAKAAATKASATGKPIGLPPMNAYERRLIHTELAIRPDVETKSTGEYKGRYVVVTPIE